jgi:hypothetical protein
MPTVSKRKRISHNAIKTRWIDHNAKLMKVDSLPPEVCFFIRVNTRKTVVEKSLENDLTKKVIENFPLPKLGKIFFSGKKISQNFPLSPT